MIIPYLTDPLLVLNNGPSRFLKPNQYLPTFDCYLPIFSLCLHS